MAEFLGKRAIPLCLSAVLAILTPLALAGPTEAEQTREEREQAYLLKREQKRAAKEQQKLEKEIRRQAEAEAKAEAEAEEMALKEQQRLEEQALQEQQAAENEMAKAQKKAAKAGTSVSSAGLSKQLAMAQEIIRNSRLSQSPSVLQYLDLVDSQEASAQQMAAFGNFIADSGSPKVALVYYDTAVKMDKTDALLWINLGTIQRQLMDNDAAAKAYLQAIELDRTNAVAHYNLGATYDSLGKYKQAINEYKVALTLDPTLADPMVNPQAANNDRLLAVQLLLYQEQAGGLGVPLLSVPDGELPDGG